MKIRDIVQELGLRTVCSGKMSGDVASVITGDLMSFIVGKAQPGSIWITVQNHLNVAAVAVLKDIPCIIISSGRPVMEDLKARCEMEDITLLSTDESSFSLCSKLAELGLKG